MSTDGAPDLPVAKDAFLIHTDYSILGDEKQLEDRKINRHVIEGASAILAAAGLPTQLWPYAVWEKLVLPQW